MPYLILATAIFFEVVGTSALKASDGFTKLMPSLMVVVAYALSFYLLSLALRSFGVGFAYAIWSGFGIVLVASAGVLFFGEKIDLAAIIGFGLIIAGIVILNLYSGLGH